MENKIRYIASVKLYFDEIQGNSYHSVNITRTSDGAQIFCPIQYGKHYKQTAITKMINEGWIKNYSKSTFCKFERGNNYPIYWQVSEIESLFPLEIE